jgi:hypothetical protein
MALSLSQIGVLTEAGKAVEGVPFNLRSLAIRSELGIPDIRIDVHWLGRQREMLGEKEFERSLGEHLDGDGVRRVPYLLGSVPPAK